MATAAEKYAMRVPFGQRGLKDGFGNVVRTDHMSVGDVINDIVDGSGVTRQDILNKRIDQASGNK